MNVLYHSFGGLFSRGAAMYLRFKFPYFREFRFGLVGSFQGFELRAYV